MRRTAQTIEERKSDSVKTANPSEKKVNRQGNARGMHPNSRANLKEFVKGVSANPGGRPKDNASAFARLLLEGTFEEQYEGFLKQLKNGNAYAWSVLADRGYGKLKQVNQVTGADDGPIETSLTVRFVTP